MKKSFLRSAVGIAVLLAIPFVLYIAITAMRFTAFYISLARTDTNACTRYYEGARKGTIWDHGEWHHYVDFEVDIPAPREQWEVVGAPLPSDVWKIPPVLDTLRVSYRWPSNWLDPFPVSSWRICLLGS